MRMHYWLLSTRISPWPLHWSKISLMTSMVTGKHVHKHRQTWIMLLDVYSFIFILRFVLAHSGQMSLQSSSQVRLLLIFISVRCLCRETIFQKKHLLFSSVKGDCCRGVLSFWRLALFDDQRLLVLSRKHCSSSDWRVRQCGVGWRKVRLYRDPWGGVVISSTSEGAHTHTNPHTSHPSSCPPPFYL